jgi:hypothetical protein
MLAIEFDEVRELIADRKRRNEVKSPRLMPGMQPTLTISNEQSANVVLDETRVQPNEALVVHACKDCTFTISGTHVKLVIDACTNCTFVVSGK